MVSYQRRRCSYPDRRPHLKTILIDADYMAFTIAAACQKSHHWDDDIITQHIDMEKAKGVFLDAIIDAITATAASLFYPDPQATVILAWSDPGRRYFRHDVLGTYKGNRKSSGPPLGLRALREWACDQWPSIWLPRLEGDDVLGLFATGDQLFQILGLQQFVKQPRVIVGVDKDLRQIPGTHYNPTKPDEGLVVVTPIQAKMLLATQTLMGDTTDGYTGIPGVGAVKAAKLLADCDLTGSTWPTIVAAYEAAKLTEADAAQQFNCARILTSQHYNFRKNEPKLWDPSVSSTSTPRSHTV